MMEEALKAMATKRNFYFLQKELSKKQRYPEKICDLIKFYLNPEGVTANIGLISGEDICLFHENIDNLMKLDPPSSLLEELKKHHKEISSAKKMPSHKEEAFPYLNLITDDSVTNVLCSSVLTHIKKEHLIQFVIHLIRITKNSGRIIISYQIPNAEEHNQAFRYLSPDHLQSLFSSLGAKPLYHQESLNTDIAIGTDDKKEKNQWITQIYEKTDTQSKEGIYRIQEILVRDKKTSSYKLALIRSLCHIARYESKKALWPQSPKEAGFVFIPIRDISVKWLIFYWNLLHKDIQQIAGKQRKLRFENQLLSLKKYRSEDRAMLANDLDNGRLKEDLEPLLSEIDFTIKSGPINYIDTENKIHVFKYANKHVRIPINIWQSLLDFNHWIEDSLLMEWAKVTEQFNKDCNFTKYLKILTKPIFPERCTDEIRQLFQGQEIHCVWTGEKTNIFEVDHAIPYSIWVNNDLWNLFPSTKQVNRNKFDKIPTFRMIQSRSDSIFTYWDRYSEAFAKRFTSQRARSLSAQSNEEALDGLIELCERLAHTRGLERWTA